MNYTRSIDAVAYRKILEEEIAHVKENPEYYTYPTEVIAGLDAAIADLGDMPTIEPNDSFWVVHYFGPDNKHKIVSKVYDIASDGFLIVDGRNKFHRVPIRACELFEGWENYKEETA